MHSWVGYELVKVLLKYGLSPKLRSDLNKWSPELFKLFSYFGEKQRNPSKSPTRLLNILFKNTEHSSYFGKLPFGKRTKFEKMANTTKGVNHVHMSKANTEIAVKTESFHSIKPNKKILKKLSNLFLNGRRGFCIGKVPMCRT